MAEAEAEVRAAFARFESPDDNPRLKGKKPPRSELYHVLLASGRMREAYAVWKGPGVKPGGLALREIDIALAKGSAEDLEAAWIRLAETGDFPGVANDSSAAARNFALVGDKVRARDRILRAKSTQDWAVTLNEWTRREGDAILAWSEGRTDEADRLIAENARDTLLPRRFYAVFLVGSFHFTSGDCPGAVKHLEEARAVPWPSQPWYRSYFLPLILHRLATCYENTGDLPKARERNDEMLKRWERADPDIPLLTEAKAMRERLAVK